MANLENTSIENIELHSYNSSYLNTTGGTIVKISWSLKDSTCKAPEKQKKTLVHIPAHTHLEDLPAVIAQDIKESYIW